MKTILDEVLEKLPEEYNMSDITSKTAERSPYTLVCFQECERMNQLVSEMRRSLKELDLGLKVCRYVGGGLGEVLFLFLNIHSDVIFLRACQRGNWPSPPRWRGCSRPCSSTMSQNPGPSWPTPPRTAWLFGGCRFEQCKNPNRLRQV